MHSGGTSLDHSDGAVALWRQLKIVLRDQALYQLDPGARLPSIKDLSEQYHVSAITVREALASLIAEGYFFSERGRGIFVAPRKMSIQGFRARTGHELTREYYTHEVVEADERLRATLRLSQSSKLIKMRYLLKPCTSLVVDHPRTTIEETWYIKLGVWKALNVVLDHGGAPVNWDPGDALGDLPSERTFEVVQADRWRAELLGVHRNSALLLLDLTGSDNDGATVFHLRRFYPANFVRITI